jgi:formate/nitrite transporter FocA (FNT family)
MHLNAHEFNVLHKPLFNRNIDETTYSIRLTVTLTNKTTQDQIITNIIHIGLTAYVSIWLLVILGIIIGAIILAALFSKWYNRKKLKRLKIK